MSATTYATNSRAPIRHSRASEFGVTRPVRPACFHGPDSPGDQYSAYVVGCADPRPELRSCLRVQAAGNGRHASRVELALSSHDMSTRPWLTCMMVKGEHDLERREAEVAAREAALAERMEASDAILGAASERDASGDARDAAAEKREKETDLSHLLDTEPNPVYGDDWPQRRHAQLDRQHAKSDREASQDDRIALTAGDAEHRGDET